MIVYLAEMWRYGSEWVSRVASDDYLIAPTLDAAKIRMSQCEDWSVGYIVPYDVEEGKTLGLDSILYFEKEYDVVEQVDFGEIYTAYR